MPMKTTPPLPINSVSPQRSASRSRPEARGLTPAGARRLKSVVLVAASLAGIVLGVGSAFLSDRLSASADPSARRVSLDDFQAILEAQPAAKPPTGAQPQADTRQIGR